MNKLFLTIFIFVSNIIFSQGDWRQFLPEYDHLPKGSEVTKIKVDRFNNIWFGLAGADNIYGVSGGLAKYDGHNWEQFTTRNSSLPDNYIKAIEFDLNDNTWVGMKDSGIVIISNDSIQKADGYKQYFKKGTAKNITADKKGNIWILFSSVIYSSVDYKPSALIKYDGINWFNFNLDSLGFPGATVLSIALDINDNLYCGSYEIIKKFDGENWSSIPNFGSDAHYITFDPSGKMWIGTDNSNGEIFVYDGQDWNYQIIDGYFGGYPTDILFDKDNNAWVSSYSGGDYAFAKYNGTSWQHFNRKNSALLWDGISTLDIDTTGTLWCGTPFGACTYNGGSWKYYHSSGGIPYENVNKVVVDNQNNKWIATDRFGLVKYNSSTWQIYDKTNSGIPFNDVNDIVIDTEGSIWVGTGNGLGKFDGEGWNVYNENNTGFPIDNIWDIEIDGKGKLWLTTFDKNSLFSFDGNNWEVFNSSNSMLPQNFIGRLGIDQDDKIWVGTSDGFFIYDGINWTNYNIENSDLPDNWVQCFAFDSLHNSWIGTANGLVKIKDNVWEVFNPNNTNMVGWDINDIAIDLKNNIWMGFYWGQGITKYDRHNWKHYNNEFESGSGGIDALSIDFDNNGNLWIGTTFSGLLLFNEDKIVTVEKYIDLFEKSGQNVSIYPNPFNSQTNIAFTLNEASTVNVKIFSLTGELVTSMVPRLYPPGESSFLFNANNLTSGIYFCSLEIVPISQTQKYFYTKKLLLLK
ncbi:MAG: two-component regulator propeller domain-containing protein [Bacteroidota bacterium]